MSQKTFSLLQVRPQSPSPWNCGSSGPTLLAMLFWPRPKGIEKETKNQSLTQVENYLYLVSCWHGLLPNIDTLETFGNNIQESMIGCCQESTCTWLDLWTSNSFLLNRVCNAYPPATMTSTILFVGCTTDLGGTRWNISHASPEWKRIFQWFCMLVMSSDQ